jgi:hypothetical protein
MLTEKKAVSTLVLIILLLCAVVFGAIISYLLVMTDYYNMPENTTLLIVENVVFPDSPILDVSYFNVTILNPSNSVLDVNITGIQLTIEGKVDTYNVTETEPGPLPFLMKRGTRQTFKCLENWSEFAGENIRIEPIAANVSTKSFLCHTPNVKLSLKPKFDETVSVEYFNLTVENLGTLNLTISDITVQGESVSNNVTPPITPPIVLISGQSETFKCDWSWDWRKVGIQNITITVKTLEGYQVTYATGNLPGAILSIEDIKFDYSADTAYFNLTVRNSQDSNVTAALDKVNLTLTDGTTITLDTEPPLNFPVSVKVPPNESLTIKCIWNWTEHRNETVTINLYTRQGFMVPSLTVDVPPTVVWNITDLKFDLDYTHYFLVNVTNMPCSLQSITVTKILLDGTETTIETQSATLASGEQKVFNCSISWKNFIGGTVNVTVLTADRLSISRTLAIPAVKLELLGETPLLGDFQDPNINIAIPYINITISNSVNSLQRVTINKIVIEGNGVCEVDGSLSHPKLVPEGYILNVGETVTIICPWNYGMYLPTQGKLTVTVYTVEGFQASKTWYIP